MKRAIVLSGGGSRGAYQVGFWKALKKLNIKYDIVVGTSVGAINGALMSQKQYHKCYKLWNNISSKDIFNDNIENNLELMSGQKNILSTNSINILNGGMDVDNLAKLLNKSIDEKRLRHSSIEFALITVKFPSMKKTILTKKQIPDGQIKDYVLASASCFPIFKKKTIDNHQYIDGGYYDNLPINQALELKADEIIAVDLGALGIKKSIQKNDAKITIIKPRNNLGTFLVFHKDIARRCIRLGYNDTIKTFGKLDGKKYTFKKNQLHKNWLKYYPSYNDLLKKTFKNKKYDLRSLAEKSKFYNKTFDKFFEKDFIDIMETAGKIFNIDDSFIYSTNKYNSLLLKKIDKINVVSNSHIISKNFRLTSPEEMIKYIYTNLDTNKNIKKLYNLALLFPKRFAVALYLKVIK